MKFTCTATIPLSRDNVVALFNNPDNMKFWQEGFVSFEHKSGIAGQVGAQSTIKYNNKGREMILTETIIANNLPEEFHGSYEGDWGKNTMYNYFTEIDANETLWTAEIEYTEMHAFMMKLMAFVVPGIFKKQTQKWMDVFRVFAVSRGGGEAT